VVDRIWKASRNTRQGNDLLWNKFLNLNDNNNDSATTFPPSLNLGGTALIDQFINLLAQNDRAFWSMETYWHQKAYL